MLLSEKHTMCSRGSSEREGREESRGTKLYGAGGNNNEGNVGGRRTEAPVVAGGRG
jgi:hypothetical protein